MLSSSREQIIFKDLSASRPRPRPSKCVLEDVLETKDVLEDSTSGIMSIRKFEFCIESFKIFWESFFL